MPFNGGPTVPALRWFLPLSLTAITGDDSVIRILQNRHTNAEKY
jgi:hypothetical protein